MWVKDVQVAEVKTKLEEKINTLEQEKSTLLEEVRKLKDIAELSEKAKELEEEVNKLKDEVKALKDKIPQEFLQELEGVTLAPLNEENESDEEYSSCEKEDLI